MALKPPVEVPQGAIRLNTDSQKLEFYAQDQWWEMATDVASPIATRGVLAGGYTPAAWVNTIDYIMIATAGNAVEFGDLTEPRGDFSGTISSETRGCFAGGYFPSPQIRYNVIDYVTIATQGNALDFGDLLVDQPTAQAASSPTRYSIYSGAGGGVLKWYAKTFATLGNVVEFGDTVSGTYGKYGGGGTSNGHGGL